MVGFHLGVPETGSRYPSGILAGPYRKRKLGIRDPSEILAGPYKSRNTGTLARPYKNQKTGTLVEPCKKPENQSPSEIQVGPSENLKSETWDPKK